MTDDLDDLKSLMNRATPRPDAARKRENIALAQKNFADLQGSRDGMRPTSDRPKTGFISGVRTMLNALTSRAGLTASTAIVAVGFIALLPQTQDLMPRSPSAPPPSVVLKQQPPTTSPAPALAQGAAPAPQMELQAQDYAVTAPAAATRMRVQGDAASGMVMPEPPILLPEANTESFANAEANPVKITAEDPVSTFSIDVDTASYAVIRNALTSGQMPPADAVRIEEMINYFPYDYAAPADGAAFRPTVTLNQTPWNPDTQLLQIGIEGAALEVENRPPLNLVFLIDTSGSMQNADKLPLLKQSFRLMLGQLRPEDQIAIVTYAGSAGQVLAPTPASDRSTILNALENLEAGGSTAGQAGLQQAYATAAKMAKDGEVSRVILATDGDFNVGLSNPEALKDYIADQRDTGTYLSVLGFGRGNLDDATMQALAQNGNGTAAYIDTLSEAQKVLVDQLSGALFPIADDVKIQVEFNPATVAEYRLIGYETRALRREDFNNDAVDAGDIGAGHQVTALYEVTPVGSPAILNDDLRYATEPARTESDELAFLRLRYKAPGASDSTLIETPIVQTNATDPTFAAAIAGFGQLLRDGSYTGDWSYADAIALATRTKGDDPFGYRTEAIQLMRLAQSLSVQ
ncbi:Von Willebrand factor type A domain protein [Sulfitobacter noctilucae]|uniref:vWA domain-containing protein n=1 Tax=Sulfitobacter noctilucae TaxID=1342302 RepID=UPI00046A623D|nr:VWA domain-containing protein [Sulfitobacter noctilucae]KIN65503.1 Von Willebrand factor type A domain protein [Sulfitobacter noctilucae]